MQSTQTQKEGEVPFTQQESAVYDRQLRVWGIHVQKQLQKARILIVGDNGMFAEVAKNAVLAGVGSVVLFSGMFHFNGEEGSNFLANCHPEMPSTNACVRVLQEMNPLVSVKRLEQSSVDAGVLRGFDVVCLTGGSLMEQDTLNQLCREARVKFCCARCTGPFGWMFLDLFRHEYTSDTKDVQPESRILDFCSLREAFLAPIENLPKKLHGLYLILRVCMDFEVHHKRPPGRSDYDALISVIAERFPHRTPDTRILRLYLENTEEFPPVCSLMGGMLANELVKIASLNGDPIQNFLLYDIFDGKGILHLVQ